jgi:hypothetical protein
MGFDLSTLTKKNNTLINKAMVYTNSHIFWGNLELDENQKAERLLTGASIPDNVCIKDGKFMNPKFMGTRKPNFANEIFIPTEKIIGFLIMGDKKEYPAQEPHWIKKDITILLGYFKISASIWMGPKINIHKHLELNKSLFMDIYDVSISIPELKDLKPIRSKKMTIRKNKVVYLAE